MLVTFWRFKQVRPHPSGYIAWRSMFDLTFAVQVLSPTFSSSQCCSVSLISVRLQFIVLFGTDDQKAHCGIFGFLTQLSILGERRGVPRDLMLTSFCS